MGSVHPLVVRLMAYPSMDKVQVRTERLGASVAEHRHSNSVTTASGRINSEFVTCPGSGPHRIFPSSVTASDCPCRKSLYPRVGQDMHWPRVPRMATPIGVDAVAHISVVPRTGTSPPSPLVPDFTSSLMGLTPQTSGQYWEWFCRLASLVSVTCRLYGL